MCGGAVDGEKKSWGYEVYLNFHLQKSIEIKFQLKNLRSIAM